MGGGNRNNNGDSDRGRRASHWPVRKIEEGYRPSKDPDDNPPSQRDSEPPKE